jgi:hypothetical protein
VIQAARFASCWRVAFDKARSMPYEAVHEAIQRNLKCE